MRMLRNLVRSFGFAFEGVFYTIASQRNARIEFLVGLLVVIVAAWLRVSRGEWAILLLTIGLVLAAETMNTAIEKMVDLLSPEKQQSAKHAKDAAAGAVLVTSMAAAVVGFVILGPPLWARLFGQ
jgi:diacylglycerol kinase